MNRREFAFGATALAVPGLLALPAHAQSGTGYNTLKERAPVDAPAGADDDLRHLMHELKAAVLARGRTGDVDARRLDAVRAILRQARTDIEALA